MPHKTLRHGRIDYCRNDPAMNHIVITLVLFRTNKLAAEISILLEPEFQVFHQWISFEEALRMMERFKLIELTLKRFCSVDCGLYCLHFHGTGITSPVSGWTMR
jgi:hypothetical protein